MRRPEHTFAALALVGLAVLGFMSGCTKRRAEEEERGPRKPRVDVTIALAASAAAPDAVTVEPGAPPATRQMFERSGLRLAAVGVPAGEDLGPLLRRVVAEAEAAGSNATILLTSRCLRELETVLEKDVAPFWTVALVVGLRCDGAAVKSHVGAAALVETGSASAARITFDRHTRAFLKVEPVR